MMIKKNLLLRYSVVVVLFALAELSVMAKTRLSELVCEYLQNPIGIANQHPRLSWKIVSDEENVMQKAYEIKVVDNTGGILWNSGKVTSDQSVNVEYQGKALKSMQKVEWQVRIWDQKGKVSKWSDRATWEMGILDEDTWTANWISVKEEKGGETRPCQYFRKEFDTSKKVSSARVYVTSLGLYQLFINGKKVSKDLFTPGWTSYNKRLQYQVYDVTSMIGNQNAVGAILGDGWYRGEIGWAKQNNYYGEKLALLLQLEINYTDGTSETIISDDNWKATTGPILGSSIYHGESYDARLELGDWSSQGFDDVDWQSVASIDHSKKILVSSQSDPVQGVKELKPIKLITTPKGETVLDMGQNMTGWVRMVVNGKSGDKVVLSFAEVLDKHGNFYTENLRRAKATDTYVLKGGSDETFEPHFTFHGFRYVKLEGYPGTPELDDFTGVAIYSAMKPTGEFSCSDSLINQLQHNIQWGQCDNFLDVPTDCPQRDERLGWTGDAQVFCPTAAYNYNVAPFFTKWMKDVAVDQFANGVVPHVVPDVMLGRDGGSTAWADVSVIIPWTIYQVYGDTRILEDQYQSMQAWVDYMKTNAGDNYLWTNGNHFGDWLAFATTNSDYPGATTEKDLIATAYFYHSTNLLSKIAGVIGKKDDEESYRGLCDKIKKAFVSEYVTPNGRLVSHTQTAYVLAISFGILPDALKSQAAEYLAGDVEKFRHLTTGFVGTPLLCSTLSAIGRDDLAFMLLMRKEYPSWLYPVTQGATTIWERWDGQKTDGSFQDVSMNSFNHYAYGAIGEWLYTYVAGIKMDAQFPGYKHFILSPHVGGGLTQVSSTYDSMYGEIRSEWVLEGKEFVYNISIPANTSARIILPGSKLEEVSINSIPANSYSGVETHKEQEGFVLGSGNYQIKYAMGNINN
ncbi:alpha-L-rhamnosidase [Plebeiibacterium marinum]|uniref:alpha-L-rhamnosidase n=1 Tax=Plebeiibacterium marinum TaxID=2992111 RepID=A0AAE3SJL2_9BACT|nr:alpha-L-rhamnosidase [Plebeiobacterium marinum]MCW3804475.1 glycoside hydrolase family 78 protein [Plebeiobacterium marinum]